MSSTVKNIVVILGALTIAFAGYYMYVQNKNSSLSFDENVALTPDMLASTQEFMETRIILEAVSLDTGVFEDPLFRSYQSFATPPLEVPYGRINPFGRAISPNTILNF